MKYLMLATLLRVCLLALTIIMFVVVIVAVLSGCRIQPVGTPPEVQVDPGVCIREPPPQGLPYRFVRGGEENCPSNFSGCLQQSSFDNILNTLEAMWSWEDAAWLACGDPTEMERRAGQVFRVGADRSFDR